MSKEQYIEKHFPSIDPGAKPVGNQVMIQLRTVPKKVGSIVLVEDTRDFNQGNTQVARVVRVGQIAFKNRETGQEWKEGAWAQVGDIVLAPRYGGFRFEIPLPNDEGEAIFAIINDFDIKMVIEDNFSAFDKIL